MIAKKILLFVLLFSGSLLAHKYKQGQQRIDCSDKHQRLKQRRATRKSDGIREKQSGFISSLAATLFFMTGINAAEAESRQLTGEACFDSDQDACIAALRYGDITLSRKSALEICERIEQFKLMFSKTKFCPQYQCVLEYGGKPSCFRDTDSLYL